MAMVPTKVKVAAPHLVLGVGDGCGCESWTTWGRSQRRRRVSTRFTLPGAFERASLRLDCFVPGGDVRRS